MLDGNLLHIDYPGSLEPVLRALDGPLWHATGPDRLDSIFGDGEVEIIAVGERYRNSLGCVPSSGVIPGLRLVPGIACFDGRGNGARSDFHGLCTGAGPSLAQAPVGRR